MGPMKLLKHPGVSLKISQQPAEPDVITFVLGCTQYCLLARVACKRLSSSVLKVCPRG